MANAGARGNDSKILKRLLSPTQKYVALSVTLIFDIGIKSKSAVGAELIDLNRMVNDEIDGNERINFVRRAAELLHGVAHGGQVDDRGHAGEILHEHARGSKSNFFFFGARGRRAP